MQPLPAATLARLAGSIIGPRRTFLLSTPARKRHTQKKQISRTGVKSPPDMRGAARSGAADWAGGSLPACGAWGPGLLRSQLQLQLR